MKTTIHTFILINTFLLISSINICAQDFTKITSGSLVTDVTTAIGHSWADYDGDGDLDLLVLNRDENNNLYNYDLVNNTFNKIDTGAIVNKSSVVGTTSSWSDFDNDGDLDLVVLGDAIYIYINDNGQGYFREINLGDNNSIKGIDCAWVDYDEDGDLDLFITAQSLDADSRNRLFRNDGNETFTSVIKHPITTESTPSNSSSWSDYDNDGDLDLFVSNLLGNNSTLYNNDGGTFSEVGSNSEVKINNESSLSSSWADYNNDGFLDLHTTIGSAPSSVIFKNDQDGTFTKIPLSGFIEDNNTIGSTWGDYDNDGDLDLLVSRNKIIIYTNNGDDIFTATVLEEEGQGEFVVCSWADYDNDGDLDIFGSNIGVVGKNVLFQNNGNTNNWINITLQGTVSNASAIGAKVKLKANDIWMLREVTSQTGYLSQNSLNVEFGLGDATTIDSLIIEWPSGITETFLSVSPNLFITIIEGQMSAPQNLVAEVISSEQINLTWEDNVLNETYYMIERSLNQNDGYELIDSVTTNNTEYQDTGLTLDVIYYYRIKARNDSQESGYSNIVSGRTNDRPEVNEVTKTGNEEVSIFYQSDDFTAKFSDENPGDELVEIQILSLPDTGSLRINAIDVAVNQVISKDNISNLFFIPEQNWNGTTSFTYKASDGKHFSIDAANATIQLNPVNDIPTFLLSGDLVLDEDFDTTEEVTITAGFIPDDELTQTVTYSISPTESDIVSVVPNATTGITTFTAKPDKFGTQEFTITADDGEDENNTHSETFTVTINPINDAPKFSVSGDIEVLEDFTTTEKVTVIPETVADGEEDQVVTYSTIPDVNTVNFATFTFNGLTGETTVEAKDDLFGTQTFKLIADDGQAENNTDTVEFTVTVLPLPETPTGVSAEVISSSQINLSWTDINDEEEGYVIERSEGNSDDFEPLFTTLADEDSYSDTGLKPFTTYYYQVRARGVHGDSDANGANATTLYKVIVNTDFPSEYLFAEEVDTIFLNLNPAEAIASINFHYEGIADTIPHTIPVTVEENGVHKIPLSDDMFDEIGMRFFFTINTVDNQEINTELNRIYIKYTGDGIAKNDLKFGNSIISYQIIAIPLDLKISSVEEVLVDDLGSYDINKWRLYNYFSAKNNEYQDGFTSIEAGKGYWLITKEQKAIDTGEGTTQKVRRDKPFVINLVSGWSQIGNPYNFNVFWPDVLAHNNQPQGLGNLRKFDGGFKTADRLERFRGGFIHADFNMSIEIPVIKNENINPRKKEIFKSNPIDEEAWEVRFSLNNHMLEYPIGGLGMHPDARISKDQFDEITPPALAEYLELNFDHPEFFAPKFTKDVVPTQESYTWEFTVNSSQNAQNILKWNQKDFGNNDLNLILLDVESQKTIDMKSISEYRFINNKETTRFKVYFGDQEYIDNELIPETINIGNLYPNPAHEKVMIPITLSESDGNYQLSVDIYDLKGRIIKQVNYENLNDGYHEIQFDLLNQQDINFQKGLYLFNIKIMNGEDTKEFTKKLIVK